MSANVEKVISEACVIPPMPQVAMRLMEAVNDPSCGASTLTQIISADQGLASQVLKIANSAFYGCPREVPNLTLAIVVLGFRKIKNLVISMSTKNIYAQSPNSKKLWEHSLAVGYTSHIVANFMMISQIEDIFISGLLHDIGKVVLDNHCPEKYKMVSERKFESAHGYRDYEQELFGFAHDEVGALLVRNWNLPACLEQVIQYHHSQTIPADVISKDVLRLLDVVRLSDIMCHQLRSEHGVTDELFEKEVKEVIKSLGLQRTQLSECMVQVDFALQNELHLAI